MNDKSLTDELKDRLGLVFASDLKHHIERGVVIVVSPTLDLLKTAVAVAEDDATSVQQWISEKLISHPTNEEVKSWDKQPQLQFLSVVVRPYVLAQLHESEA